MLQRVAKDLLESAVASYELENASIPSCPTRINWEEQLTDLPLTFLPRPDGSLNLYYAVSDLSTECFPVLHLETGDAKRYQNAERARQYGFP